MAELEIKCEMQFGPLIAALEDACDGWSEEVAIRFNEEWRAMEQLGCEMAEIVWQEGKLIGRPNQDFVRHCIAFGVRVS